jgi:hypothetical protein
LDLLGQHEVVDEEGLVGGADADYLGVVLQERRGED